MLLLPTCSALFYMSILSSALFFIDFIVDWQLDKLREEREIYLGMRELVRMQVRALEISCFHSRGASFTCSHILDVSANS